MLEGEVYGGNRCGGLIVSGVWNGEVGYELDVQAIRPGKKGLSLRSS